MGSVLIPGTNIELINYSYCPECKKIFGFKDLYRYFDNPLTDDYYDSRKEQLREDTRVWCNRCGTFFMPSLIIFEGQPRDEAQFLCRFQTVNFIENYIYDTFEKEVLTKNTDNMVFKDNKAAWLNDLDINLLQARPSLLINLIQYTPHFLVQNFILSQNIEKRDVLFGAWFHYSV